MRNSAFKYSHIFKKKVNKYHNRKVIYDGHKFDSIGEKNRYIELQLLLKAGQIKGFKHHVIFELIPKNEHFRGVCYESDFVVWDKYGKQTVEDYKANIIKKNKRFTGRLQVYIIKKKLLWHVHGIIIKEI